MCCCSPDYEKANFSYCIGNMQLYFLVCNCLYLNIMTFNICKVMKVFIVLYKYNLFFTLRYYLDVFVCALLVCFSV